MEILSTINISIDVDFSLTWHDISKGLLKIEVKLIKFGALNTQKLLWMDLKYFLGHVTSRIDLLFSCKMLLFSVADDLVYPFLNFVHM